MLRLCNLRLLLFFLCKPGRSKNGTGLAPETEYCMALKNQPTWVRVLVVENPDDPFVLFRVVGSGW